MTFISVRDFRNKSGQIWRKLSEDKEMVLTSNGKPIAILSSVSEDTLEESLKVIRQARAIEAVTYMQMQSAQSGMHKMSHKEIEKEIRAVRKGH